MHPDTDPPLTPDTVLQRRPGLTLRLTAANTVHIESLAGTMKFGEPAVHILERFNQPTALRDIAIEPAAGAQDWVDRMNTVLLLARTGILRDPSRISEPEDEPMYAFDDPGEHIDMLNDRTRTRQFISAIGATVRRGDIVVDIGTGTGVLAMAAARAGAEHVYAIEAGAIAEQAEALIAANGYAAKITVVRGWSTTVSLPRAADVLITETIGNDPLGERILEIVADARRRMMKPDARIVPARVAIVGSAVEVADEWLAKRAYATDQVEGWRQEYGFDFSPLLRRARKVRRYWIPLGVTRHWTRLAQAQTLVDIELADAPATVRSEAVATVDRSGRLDGCLLHFDAELAPGIMLTSDPLRASPHSSWRNVLTLTDPRPVAAGETLRLEYGWRAGTGASRLSIAAPSTSIQSAPMNR